MLRAGVIGLGAMGLPMAANLAVTTLGGDPDASREAWPSAIPA